MKSKIFISKIKGLVLSLCLLCSHTGLALSSSISDTQLNSLVKEKLDSLVTQIKEAKTIQEAEGTHNLLEQFMHYVHYTDSIHLNKNRNSLCNILKTLYIDDLALIANEIEDPKHKNILSNCLIELNTRLSNYYAYHKQLLYSRFGNLTENKTISPFKVKYKEIDHTLAQQYMTADLLPGEIALTFDDGPHPSNTREILNILDKYGAKATFFSQGSAAVYFPDELREVRDRGHSVGSHSFSHPKMGTLIRKGSMTLNDAKEDITRGHETLYAVMGWVDPFFRFPHADVNADLKKFIKQEQIASFYWNMDSLDWQKTDPSKLIESTIRVINENNFRGILLFHDTKKQTALALPIILEYLKSKDVTLVVFVPQDLNSRVSNPPLVRSSSRYESIESTAREERNRDLLRLRQGINNTELN